jgi:hypothetical protein
MEDAHASLFLAKGSSAGIDARFSIGLTAHAPRSVGRGVVANINAPFPSTLTFVLFQMFMPSTGGAMSSFFYLLGYL